VPADTAEGVLTISAAEIEQAVPLPASRAWDAAPTRRADAAPLATVPRWNRLAIASLVCAIAGIPLFGAVTGLVAVVLGSLALGAIRTSRQRGTVLAVIGVLGGLADVAGWVILLVVMLSGNGPVYRTIDLSPDLAALDDLEPRIARAMRANVLIGSRPGLFGGTIGSGVIVKRKAGEALILTNRHVVDPNFSDRAPEPDGKVAPDTLDVKFVDQSEQRGRVVWLAPGGIDLALVRAPCPTAKVRAARWKPDERLRVGDAVFAIGNPHGLGWTHTQGTISQFRVQELGGRRIRYIQTQTQLNPGNSGGGLYDHDGYLIGIATWTQDKRVSEGLNFALALDCLSALTIPDFDWKAGPAGADEP
jgi:S1-C subfamily serine protease